MSTPRRLEGLGVVLTRPHHAAEALAAALGREGARPFVFPALTIEDTVLPRPFGPNGKPSMISVEEGVGKMRAALAGRQNRNLVVAGRTSALAISGIDETRPPLPAPPPFAVLFAPLGARSGGRECQQGQERNRADQTPIGHHAASSCYRVTSDDSGKPTVRCDTSSARPSRKLI